MMFDRPSRFAAVPGDMKIPPAWLYPDTPARSLWRVVIATGELNTQWTWERYAGSSSEATTLAVEWVRVRFGDEGAGLRIRVLEVLQVGT